MITFYEYQLLIMKNGYLFVLFMIFSINSYSQVGLTYNPNKNGIGLLCETTQNKPVSLIVSYEAGSYKGNNQLIKYGGGFRYKKVVCLLLRNETKNTLVYKTSVEIGFVDDFTKRFKFLMLYDVVNYEARFGFILKL